MKFEVIETQKISNTILTNTNAHITPVIPCGGLGTRLWSLSRKIFPKQFVPLIGNKNLLGLTLERVAQGSAGDTCAQDVICVAEEEHRSQVGEAMQEASVKGRILLEPVASNTAPAMALAALVSAPQDLLLFCSADHHIPDVQAFVAMVQQGSLAARQGSIVTFWLVPSFPSTAYGYIEQGAASGVGSYEAARFIEKFYSGKAQALISQGNVLWNAGIFLAQFNTLLAALQQHAPEILQSCQSAIAQAGQDQQVAHPDCAAFAACRFASTDYAVLERHQKVAVLPSAGVWSDVGSWKAVAELSPPDEQGNRIDGHGHGHDMPVQRQRTYIHASHRVVVTLGTQDLLVIATPDALLVDARSHAEQVKSVVAQLEARRSLQASLHRKVARPWCRYDSIDCGKRFQGKRITLRPGAKLSLQMHHHCTEHWIVVKGTALVTRGEEEILLAENQSTYIPLGVKHRLENPGKTELEMIEVQSGSYLGEDDIVRFEDNYGRG